MPLFGRKPKPSNEVAAVDGETADEVGDAGDGDADASPTGKELETIDYGNQDDEDEEEEEESDEDGSFNSDSTAHSDPWRPMGRTIAGRDGEYAQITVITFKEWIEEKMLTQAALQKIIFSMSIWMAFLASMYAHSRVPDAYMVQNAISTDLNGILAMERTGPTESELLAGLTTPAPVEVEPAGRRLEAHAAEEPASNCSCGLDILRPAAEITGASRGVRLASVRDADDVWFWIRAGLLPHLFVVEVGDDVEESEVTFGREPRRLAHWNQVMGIRLAQSRARKQPCGLPGNLQKWYGHECHSINGGFATSWGSELTAGVGAVIPDTAEFAPRSKEDPRFVYEMSVDQKLADAQELCKSLSAQSWIDEYTAELSVELPFVDAEAQLMGAAYLQFKFHRGGAIEVETLVRVLPMTEYQRFYAPIADMAFLITMGLIFLNEMRQLLKACREEETYMEALKDNYLVRWHARFFSFLVIGCGVGIVIVYGILDLKFKALASDIGKMEPWSGILDTIDSAGVLFRNQRLLMFWYTMLLLVFWVQSFAQQPRLAVLLQTLYLAGQDILHFLLIFLVVFFNFVVGGHILFGTKLKAWSTLLRSVSTTFQALMGTFDFAAMHRIAPISATCWFWMFIVTMTLLLFNLLIAIMLEHYNTMCKRVGYTSSLWEQVVEGTSDLIFYLRNYGLPLLWRKIRRKEAYDLEEVVSLKEISKRAKTQIKVNRSVLKGGFVAMRITHRVSNLGRCLKNDMQASNVPEEKDSDSDEDSDESEKKEPVSPKTLADSKVPFDFDELKICEAQTQRIVDQVHAFKKRTRGTFEEKQLDIVAGFTENVAMQVNALQDVMDVLEDDAEDRVKDVTRMVQAIEKVINDSETDLNEFMQLIADLRKDVKKELLKSRASANSVNISSLSIADGKADEKKSP